MLIQTVTFESTLSQEEALRRADERSDAYRAVPGLLQKYYVKLDKPHHYRGVMLWESKEAIDAFRETELFRTVPTAYSIKGAPSIEISEVFEVLRS